MKNKLKYIYLSIVATLIFVFTFTLVNTKTYAYTYDSTTDTITSDNLIQINDKTINTSGYFYNKEILNNSLNQGTYSLSFIYTGGQYIQIGLYNNNNDVLYNQIISGINGLNLIENFTLNDIATKITIYTNNTEGGTISNIMLNTGSTAKSYEPYGTYINQTIYNDYVNNHTYTNTEYETLQRNLEYTTEQLNETQQLLDTITERYNNLQENYEELNQQYTTLQNQYNTLQNEYTNYQNTHSYTNQQYQNLQAQIENLLGRIQSLQDSLNQLKARTSLSYLINGATIKLVDTISGVLYSETISINTNQTTFTYNDLSQNFKDAIDNNIQSIVTYDLYITLNNATDASFITEMNDPYRNHNYIGLTYEGQTWNSKIYQPIEDNNYILVNPMGFVYNEITLNTFDDNNRYFNIALNVDNYYYQNGYTNGYDTGYANGLENGDITQYNDGYTDGYEEGYTTGANSSNTLYNMVISIVDTPISIFKQIFNFDVLGINLVQIFTMIISLLIIIWLIKKLI